MNASALRRQGLVAAAGAAAIYAGAVVIVVSSQADPHASYAAGSAAARVTDLTAGLSMLAGGIIAFWARQLRRVGLLATTAGLLWFAADWDGWQGGPDVVRSLGAAATPLGVAVVVHLVLGFPTGWPRPPLSRAVIWSAYAAAVVASLGLVAFRDPFLDPYCWRNCMVNTFLLDARPALARQITSGWLTVMIATNVVAAAITAGRLARYTGPGRRRAAPVLLPGILFIGAQAVYALALVRRPLEDPTAGGFSALFLARSLSLTALAFGLVWIVFAQGRQRVALARLGAALASAPQPGTLRQALATALSDPTLRIIYRLPESDRFVDGMGQDESPPAVESGRVVTKIVRGGRPIAHVVHDATLMSPNELEREIGSTARLAVDNERLHAALLARLEELRASSGRVVARSDAERRRLERDLHDGAQQQLLALSYHLQVARAHGQAEHVDGATSLIEQAIDEVQVAITELRRLAEGIYPAVLADAGLATALTSLSDITPIPMDMAVKVSGRLAAPVEAAAYVIVAETVSGAAQRGATAATVTITQEDGALKLSITDDGGGTPGGFDDLADRVGALGGSLVTDHRGVTVVLPCG